MKILVVVNQKGGVGKTSTCINLAACLSMQGRKVLVVDADPQSNCTSGLGVERSKIKKSIYDCLLDPRQAQDVILKDVLENLDLLPSTIDLAGSEIELVSAISRENRLKNYLNGLEGYDFVIVDCPPSLGLLTLNALVASNALIVPIQSEFFALEGLMQLFRTVQLVRDYLNPSIEVMGLLLTMVDIRTRLSREVVDEVRRQYGEAVFVTMIPRNIRISESPSHGKPVVLYDPNCPGSVAYQEFAKEVSARCQAEKH
jgi:chromosome partitioning protein